MKDGCYSVCREHILKEMSFLHWMNEQVIEQMDEWIHKIMNRKMNEQ